MSDNSNNIASLPPPSPGHSPEYSSTTHSLTSPRLRSSPILLHRLPPASVIQQESEFQSQLELQKQTQQIQTERELAEALQDQEWELERAAVRQEQGIWSLSQSKSKQRNDKDKDSTWGRTQSFIHPPQAYEMYQAIDKKDIDYIMRVRDHAFRLLLQKNGAEFPILYTARLGPGWRDVVILIIGALSRYVNHLEPEDFEKKETKDTLKGLRTNLKLAIDHSLHSASPHLLSSYLQVLIMSEGDSFLYKATYDISLLLRDPNSRPVHQAEEMVRRFCTKELRGVQGGVAGVEEYIANAALDLVIMGVWSLAAGQAGLALLPMHTFARDLRTWQVFNETSEEPENKPKLAKINPRIKKMLHTIQELGGDSKKGVRGRLRDIEEIFDERGL